MDFMNTPDSLDLPINLTHHFLIAMPSLTDDTFSKSVVYMCEHSERGALGLVINKPSSMSMKALFEKVDLPLGREDLSATPVFHGGPVHPERGVVLHEAQPLASFTGQTQFTSPPILTPKPISKALAQRQDTPSRRRVKTRPQTWQVKPPVQ